MTTDSQQHSRSGDRLPCGALADEVLTQVADGRGARRTAHQAQCPHCQAALAEHERLWAPVRDLEHEPVRVPEGPLQRALGHVRASAHDPTYGVLTGDQGQTRVAARVVVVTARETAETVGGVRVALTGLAAEPSWGERDRPVQVGLAGQSTAIVVTVAATYGQDLHALGRRIRSTVAERVRTVTGLEPVAIRVVIEDVFMARGGDGLAS